MATMSGAASPPAPLEPRPTAPEPGDDDLFATALVVSNPRQMQRSKWGARVSVGAHIVILALIVFVPIFWPEALPETTDYVRAIIYDPPPPPPPPLAKGSSLIEKTEPAKPVTPEKPDVKKPEFVEPVQPKPEPLVAENRPPDTEQFGSERGSDTGLAEGMEVGVEGGQVGGVPGGVLGGVVGGTGTGPVLDYDQPPRPIKLTKPQYPQEAFIKKIEGTVILKIYIDSTGRVVQATVIQSVPMLDAAAIRCVYDWIFSPAIKHGRPVDTIATAPVAFRIF